MPFFFRSSVHTSGTVRFLFFFSAMLIVVSFLFFPHFAHAAQTTYHVDCSATSNGDGQSAPWNTLSSVNAATFQPGDSILFKAGTTCSGSLHPQGSGNSSSVITIDSYDSGAKPIIAGGGTTSTTVGACTTSATVSLCNQQYWDIKNLEVTNDASTTDLRAGILIINNTKGSLSHIHLLNNYIHNVASSPAPYGQSNYIERAGIGIETFPNGTSTLWDDVLIDGNELTSIGGEDIIVGPNGDTDSVGLSTNVVIQNNDIHDSNDSGIFTWHTTGAKVQYNTIDKRASYLGIWTAYDDHELIQYNEISNGPKGHDFEAIDLDVYTTDTVVQYNYSHDNGAGFFVNYNGSSVKNDRNIVRYNISQNDGGGNELFRFDQDASVPNMLQVYNNTFYTGAKVFSGLSSGSITFTNNIFDLQSGATYNYGGGSSTFSHNIYYGADSDNHPSDSDAITSDPQFSSPGGAATGRQTASAYKLLSGSPALNSGALVTNNGGQDYFGNSVSSSDAPNRGAYNGAAVPGTGATNLIQDAGYESQTNATISSPWFSDLHDTTNAQAGIDYHKGTAYSGDNNGWIYTNSNIAGGTWTAIDQQVSVKADTNYVLSARVYNDTGTLGSAAHIGVASAPWSNARDSTFTPSTSTYQQVTFAFKTGSSETSIYVYVGYNAPASSNVGLRIDDWSLTAS